MTSASMAEQLAPNVPVVLQDYIYYAIQEAIAPLVEQMRMEKISSEGTIGRVIDLNVQAATGMRAAYSIALSAAIDTINSQPGPSGGAV